MTIGDGSLTYCATQHCLQQDTTLQAGLNTSKEAVLAMECVKNQESLESAVTPRSPHPISVRTTQGSDWGPALKELKHKPDIPVPRRPTWQYHMRQGKAGQILHAIVQTQDHEMLCKGTDLRGRGFDRLIKWQGVSMETAFLFHRIHFAESIF